MRRGAAGACASRLHLIRRARRICVVSMAWAAAVGTAAIIAGTRAHSVALLGFGMESAVDGIASAALLWRFAAEGRRPDRARELERTAGRLLGSVLIIVAIYVGFAAIRSLAVGSSPTRSIAGLGLAVASLAVLPLLSAVKLRLAAGLRSGALRADGVLSGAGAALAAGVLLSLLLTDTLGWRWADPVTAICIAAALAVEGGRTLLPGR